VGGFASNDYWSSTEYDISIAWFQFFDGDDQNDVSSYEFSTDIGVRAVRAF
jgi:hypothetical protein